MDEFWVSFWKICQLELQNLSLIKLAIVTLFEAGMVHIGCMVYVRKKKCPIYFRTELMILLLISYATFIAHVTLLSREAGSQARVFDAKLLWIDSSMDQNMTNLLNVILFIPYGSLLTGILRKRDYFKRILMVINYSFLSSLLIEYVQYMTKSGYCEIDDIEANVLGGLIGSISFCLCLKLDTFLIRRSEVRK